MNIKNKNNFLDNSSRSLASTSSARDAKPDREHPEQKLRLEVQRAEKPPVRPSVFAGTEHQEQDGTQHVRREHHGAHSREHSKESRAGRSSSHSRRHDSEHHRTPRASSRAESRSRIEGKTAADKGFCYAALFLREKRDEVIRAIATDYPQLNKVRRFADTHKAWVKDGHITVTAAIGFHAGPNGELGNLKPLSIHVTSGGDVSIKEFVASDSYGSVKIGGYADEEELDDEGAWEDEDDGWEDDEPTPVVKSSKTVVSSYKISPTSGGNLNWPSSSFHSNMGSSSRSTPVTPVAQSLDWSHYGLLHQVEPRPIINPPLPVKSPERPQNISNSLDFYHESSDDKCYDELPDDYVFEEGEDWGTLTWPLPSTGVVAAAMDATLDTEPLSAEISSPLEKTISDAVNAVIDDVVDSADPVFAALEAATQFRPVASRDITSLVPKAVGTCLSALASGNQPVVVARSGSTGIVGFINGLIEVYKTIIVACDNFDKSMRVHPGWNVVTSAEHIVNGRVNLGETRDLGSLPEIVKGSFIVVVVDFDNWTVKKQALFSAFDGKIIRTSSSLKLRSTGKRVLIRIPREDKSCQIVVTKDYSCVVQAGRNGVFIFATDHDVSDKFYWYILKATVFPSWVKRWGVVQHWDMSYLTPRMWNNCLCDVHLGMQEPALEVNCFHSV
ncbi:hypothetical protein [Botrytis cinerea hypovirus 1 satellite-like RNA]|uniref:Uncharacterized protein n=1 Tax=Botrytis cinerea hypovirus 1 satellite-like RNA TaxID=2219109 RepID=A0A2U9NJB8_9VIRU|nr:hypothetical protein [Botrytis cinerea hypovirus 1 satellite-like RNA]AWT23239.1 hypothetical protein [Botrytis cinerea hypovirus 1 satellite-like RNA]